MLSMCGSSGGGEGVHPPPTEKSQKIGFLSNTDTDPLNNHKVAKSAFNAGQSSAH